MSRHGVMFFADPVAAFRNLAGGAAPDARLVFSCFRAFSHNPWAHAIAGLLPPGVVEAPAPETPGPFAFADRARVKRILAAAGWSDIAFEQVDYPFVAGVGADALADAVSYLLAIGPAARAAALLAPEECEAFIARLRHYLAVHERDHLIALPASAWLVSARRA